MLELALQRGGADNVTIIVVRLVLALPQSSEPVEAPSHMVGSRGDDEF
jgi:hypothetical protein